MVNDKSTVDINQGRARRRVFFATIRRMAIEEEDEGLQRVPSLKKIREIAGLNGRQLARIVGLSASMISQLETGKKAASHATLVRLCKALGCSIDQLSTYPGDYSKPLSDFLSTIAPDDIKDDEIEVLRLLRLPGRRLTARAYNNLLDALRNSEKIQ